MQDNGAAIRRRSYPAGLFLLFLALGVLLFFVFSHFRPVLPSNIDIPARSALVAALLATSLVLRRSERFHKYWLVFFAFFTAALAQALDLYFSQWSLRLLGLDSITPAGIALDKLESTFMIVVPILVLTRLSGEGMGSIYLRKGNLRLGLTIGLITFAAISAVSIPWARWQYQAGSLSLATVLPWTPWVLLFVLANSINEELLFRGLFLRKFEPFLGAFPANLAIAIPFALLHVGQQYTTAAILLLVQTLVLGLVLGYIMQKTDSIWGSFLVHAGVDLPVIIGILATLG